MRDFTLTAYQQLLEAALQEGYRLTSYLNYLEGGKKEPAFILRHDVDKRPQNSLKVAQLQHHLGVTGTYYFRIVKESFDPVVIEQIAALGHEIGYHYEDMALCSGNVEQAWEHFQQSLERFTPIYKVKTVCMHGSPLSKWDNRALWKHYNYKSLGILAEPYFDLDFEKVLYITDTGRRWDGAKVSVRDKVASQLRFNFHSTQDIINAFQKKQLPPVIMQNIHPQRWTDNKGAWLKELLLQNTKNVVKRTIFVGRNKA